MGRIRVYSFVARNPRARKTGGKPGPLVWRAKIEEGGNGWAEGRSANTALAQLYNTYPFSRDFTVDVED